MKDRCQLKLGFDGKGDSEKKIGTGLSDSDCIQQCIYRGARAITMNVHICYCEYGQSSQKPSSRYKNCYIDAWNTTSR